MPSINPVSRANNPRVPLPATSIPPIALPVPAGKVRREQNSQQNQFDTSFNNDFVADFSKVPDPIYAFIPNTISNQPPVQANFANFDRENILNLSNNSDTMKLNNGTNAPPSEDRYAALKDLDSLMKKASLQNDSTDLNASHWSITNSNDSNNSIWNSELYNSNVISNPFKSDAWNTNSSATILNNNVQSVDTALYNTANPFTMAKQSQFPLNGDPQWTTAGSASNDDVIASSQLMMSLSNRSWQPTITGQYVNPFMVGPATRNARNSNNPFL